MSDRDVPEQSMFYLVTFGFFGHDKLKKPFISLFN